MAIVVDTSALAAIVFGEPDANAFATVLLANGGDVHVSAATLVESEIVLESRQGMAAVQDLKLLLSQISAAVVEFDHAQAALAAAAWRRFGKGRHPAALNFGDCFSYALSKHLGVPLLFKGNDFSLTDVVSAM
ncbi:type II toxin-antitoxin system VapC family toxin [Brooklawnia cerclae]|uniref:Ribonuclease VapC n=1 Tax=Brooklawnia cerclae TaxID=349934 RepID=A0ABX0SEH7_9ACTN|nr:type II toxin-antitoxin system VapC family toxin [Brooklawnia cerclae]NIH56769.1 ribonuclease VapC [Brooklawnia cerclae]